MTRKYEKQPPICKVEDCDLKPYALKLCRKHYARFQTRDGDLSVVLSTGPTAWLWCRNCGDNRSVKRKRAFCETCWKQWSKKYRAYWAKKHPGYQAKKSLASYYKFREKRLAYQHQYYMKHKATINQAKRHINLQEIVIKGG